MRAIMKNPRLNIKSNRALIVRLLISATITLGLTAHSDAQTLEEAENDTLRELRLP